MGGGEILRRAWEHGVLLSGMSAGAICWFQDGFTDSFGDSHYRLLSCLDLLDGACSVHHSGDPARALALHDTLLAGGLSSSVAIDDFAAVLYEADSIRQCVSWRANATAHRVFVEDGRVCEASFESVPLFKTP
jgi:dipeptidase E